MAAALKIPAVMTMAEFLAWNAPPGPRWQLVDGEPQAMAPASRTHGAVQSELARLIGNHLGTRGGGCSILSNPGIVPRVRADGNFRIPDLGVTCSSYREEEYATTDPVLVIEILSPSNQAETWTNVWAYTTIPSVREILVVRSVTIGAELLRRGVDGTWPERTETITGGMLELESIGLQVPIADLYRTSRLAIRDD